MKTADDTIVKTLEEAKEINANSDFGGLEYLQLYTLTNKESFQYHDHTPEMISTNDWYINGYYAYYPHENGEERLTELIIKDGNYHIFGIKLGSNIEDAIKTLEQRGYEKAEYTGPKECRREFKKNDIIITFDTGVDSVTIKLMFILTDTHIPGYVE